MPGPIDLDFGAEETAAGDSTVTPPSATEEYVASSATLSAKTFGAFTDADAIIDSYSAVISSNLDNATVSGSALGPYTISDAISGEHGTLTLNALDASANVVASATHSWGINPEAGFTRWKALLAADSSVDADPNALATSFTDLGTLMRFRGSSHTTVTPTQGAQYQWTLTDPDTDAFADWNAGGYMGVQFIFVNSANIPSSAGNFIFFGVKQDGANIGRAGGVGFDTTDRLFSTNYGATSFVNTTLTTSSMYMVNIDVYDSNTAGNVNFVSETVDQFDDAATPAHVIQALRGGTNATSSPSNMILHASFSGNADVTCYYRFMKVIESPF